VETEDNWIHGFQEGHDMVKLEVTKRELHDKMKLGDARRWSHEKKGTIQ